MTPRRRKTDSEDAKQQTSAWKKIAVGAIALATLSTGGGVLGTRAYNSSYGNNASGAWNPVGMVDNQKAMSEKLNTVNSVLDTMRSKQDRNTADIDALQRATNDIRSSTARIEGKIEMLIKEWKGQ